MTSMDKVQNKHFKDFHNLTQLPSPTLFLMQLFIQPEHSSPCIQIHRKMRPGLTTYHIIKNRKTGSEKIINKQQKYCASQSGGNVVSLYLLDLRSRLLLMHTTFSFVPSVLCSNWSYPGSFPCCSLLSQILSHWDSRRPLFHGKRH